MKIYVLSPDIDFTRSYASNRRKIVSVFLRGHGEMRDYRCNTCGSIVFQYSGEVSSFYEGAKITKDKATIDVMCPKCKLRYRVI